MYKLYADSRCQLEGHETIRNYITGGRGVVTLLSPSGKHHTYVFRKPKRDDDFPDDVIFVYALHNNNKLFYIGMIEQGKFRLTRSSRFLPNTAIVKGARYIMRMSESDWDTPMKLYHEGMCARCGRPLTNPKSIKLGVGPKCRGLQH